MIEVSAAVEIDQWLQRNRGGDVVGGLGGGQLFREGVVAGDVCLVVFRVVELHDVAGDGGLERCVVVWGRMLARREGGIRRGGGRVAYTAGREGWLCHG